MKAPSASAAAEPTRRIITTASPSSAAVEREVLVVASRLKDYVQKRGGMNTSGRVMEVLSDYLRAICDQAMDNARAEGRKTILDRDLLFLRDKI
jgi:histone H3/H4